MRVGLAVVAWGLLLACAGGMVGAQAARLPDGTAVHVRLTADLVSSDALEGSRVDFEIVQAVMAQGAVVIPSGTMAWGAVQVVKKGKVLHFDVEGLRLANSTIVKLRCSPQRTNRATKDEIKVETQVRGDLGAAKGSEFTAYLDQDVDVAGAPVAAPVPAKPAPVAPPAPAVVPTATAHVEAPPAPPTPVAPRVVSAPSTPVAAPVTHPAPAVQPGEYITVECFSDPSGADIMIDDEFHGSTPSILKLPPGNHQIEFRTMGYKAHSQPLNLMPGTGLRTVRMTLDKQ